MYVHMSADAFRLQSGAGSPGTRVPDSCEQAMQEATSGLLQEQDELLTAEPSLWAVLLFFLKNWPSFKEKKSPYPLGPSLIASV